MTGFGRASGIDGSRRFVVEVRSVNARGLDVKLRARELDGACELEVLREVRAKMERGSVTVIVRDEGTAEGALAVDPDRVRRAHAVLQTLSADLGLPGRVDLATVAAFVGAREPGASEGASPLSWQAVRPALATALAELHQMRAREGAALGTDVAARLDRLSTLVDTIDHAAAGLPTRAARRLTDRLAALGVPDSVEPARLAQEVALLAEKLDVSEEVVRLRSHIAHVRVLMQASDAAIGRKLDFFVQELGRELNTVASKVQDAQIAALVVDGKAELEKIREQAQNIE